MKRRTFMQITAATAGVLAASKARAEGLAKREYKDGIKLSVIGFGGIVVVGMEQKQADRTVAEAFERGVNYFDVAPSYFDGEAETKLGPAWAPCRGQAFLACKTEEGVADRGGKQMEERRKRLK